MATLTQARSTSRSTDSSLKRGAWLLIAACATFLAYFVLAVTWGTAYEEDILAIAAETGKTVDTISAADLSRLALAHETFMIVGAVILILPAGVFLAAVLAIGKGLKTNEGAPFARYAVLAAIGSAVVWYAYWLLNVGLFFGPDNLPPLTRNLDVLNVPLPAAQALLGLAALILIGCAFRAVGIVRKAALAAIIIAAFFAVLGSVLVLSSGFEETIPPPVFVPSSLILAIALLRMQEQPGTNAHS